MTFQRTSPCWPWNILPAVFSVGLCCQCGRCTTAKAQPGWASEIQLVKFPPTSSSLAEQLPDSVRNNHLGAAHGASYRPLPGNWSSHWQQGREKCLNYRVQIFHARGKIFFFFLKKRKIKKVLWILSGCKMCISLIGVQWFQSRETVITGALWRAAVTGSLPPHTCLHCTDYTAPAAQIQQSSQERQTGCL